MTPASLLDFIALAAIWGSSFLFMRLSVGDFGPVPMAAVRVAIAAAFLLPLLLWRGEARLLRRHWLAIGIIGVLNSGVPFLLWGVVVLSISTGLAGILNATAPLFGALVAWAWLKERPTGTRVLGLVVGFLGVAMLAWDTARIRADAAAMAAMWAVLAALAATLLYGITASATKRYLSGIPPLVTAAGSQLGAALALALPAAWLWPRQMPGGTAWLAVIVAGVLCTGFAYFLYFRLIAQAGAAQALAVTFLIPVFAVGYGVLFLSEQVTPWMLACGVVIVCGTALSTGLWRPGAVRTRP